MREEGNFWAKKAQGFRISFSVLKSLEINTKSRKSGDFVWKTGVLLTTEGKEEPPDPILCHHCEKHPRSLKIAILSEKSMWALRCLQNPQITPKCLSLPQNAFFHPMETSWRLFWPPLPPNPPQTLPNSMNFVQNSPHLGQNGVFFTNSPIFGSKYFSPNPPSLDQNGIKQLKQPSLPASSPPPPWGHVRVPISIRFTPQTDEFKPKSPRFVSKWG